MALPSADPAPKNLPELTDGTTGTEISSLASFPIQATDYSKGDIDHQQNEAGDSQHQQDDGKDSGNKAARKKRFSLKALAKPFRRVVKKSAPASPLSSEEQPAILFPSPPIDLQIPARRQSMGAASEGRPQQSALAKHHRTMSEQRRVSRRVSFSPSTEDEELSKHRSEDDSIPTTADSSRDGKQKVFKIPSGIRKGLKLKRSASFNDSIGRSATRPPLHRRRTLSFTESGIHVTGKSSEAPKTTGHDGQKGPEDKGSPSKARVTRKQATAARHAQVLERIINSGSSFELEILKEKRAKKLGATKTDKKGVQHYPVVSPRKVKALKEALMDLDMANGIIGELRTMEIDPNVLLDHSSIPESDLAQAPESQAEGALKEVSDADLLKKGHASRKKVRPPPLKAIWLNCTEEEADERKRKAREAPPPSTKTHDGHTGHTKEAVEAAMLAGQAVAETGLLGGAVKAVSKYFRFSQSTQAVEMAQEVREDIREGDYKEALADSARVGVAGMKVAQPVAGALAEAVEDRVLPENKVPGQPNSPSVIAFEATSVVSSDTASTTTTTAGVLQSQSATPPQNPMALLGGLPKQGIYDAAGKVSHAALRKAHGGEDAMMDVHPPLDRMAVFIYWWGFELTLPEPSMRYLSTAHNLSSAFMGFLQTMAMTGGAPELLPFVRYMSAFMDMEFNAIRSQDRAQAGVVIAGTWLMPLALIPRPWDYATDGEDTADPPPPPPPPHSKTPATDQPKTPIGSHPSPSASKPSPFSMPTQLPQLPPGGFSYLPVRLTSTATSSIHVEGKMQAGEEAAARRMDVLSGVAARARRLSARKPSVSSPARSPKGKLRQLDMTVAYEQPCPRAVAMSRSASSSSALQIPALESLQEVPEGSLRIPVK